MKQLIENYTKIEQYCKQKQNELQLMRDLYDETNESHLQDQQYLTSIINMDKQYKQYHPLVLKEQLRIEFIQNHIVKLACHSVLELKVFQLTSQQALQYLLSILNFILNKDENGKLEFYSNPQIKIKCYSYEFKLLQTKHFLLDLQKFSSYLFEFIQYLQDPIIFNSQAIQIILILQEYRQPYQAQFKNSIRKLYIQLIQFLDLEQYLKEELLYELKDKCSPFIYKLNKCRYNICFNDNNNKMNVLNGPGFLPVLQKIQGYKGYGKLFLINARYDEWQTLKIQNCNYEILLIFKKFIKASYHLFQNRMQFRYISNNQLVQFFQSYRILYHHIEQSKCNNYVDHYKNFMFLFEQFLLENQLETAISKQFNLLIHKKSPLIDIFLEDLQCIIQEAKREIVNTSKQRQQYIKQESSDQIDQIISNSIKQLQLKILKIIQFIPETIQKWITNVFKQILLKQISLDSKELDRLKIYVLRQIESEQIEQNFLELNYFITSNFKIKKIGEGSQSYIYSCEQQITNRQFVLATPFLNNDYIELAFNIQKIHSQIPKKQRKGICKIFKINQNQIWMEYAIIGNLEDYLKKNILHFFEKLFVCQQISKIFFQLHQANIYHLDVKLENFLVFKKYGIHRIKICDFGSMADKKQFLFNNVKHRMLYAPPECKHQQLLQSDKYDLWQLGNLFINILGNLGTPTQILDYLLNLKHTNLIKRPSIDNVVQQIEIYVQTFLDLHFQNDFINQHFYQYHNEQLIQDMINPLKYNNMINFVRKEDKQVFILNLIDQKYQIFDEQLIIYDILVSDNKWSQVCLLRRQKRIQICINQQYWSINQKIIFLIDQYQEMIYGNYFQTTNDQDVFLCQFRHYADDLRSQLELDNFDRDKDFIMRIIIVQSLVIDFLQQAFKENQIMLELMEISQQVIKKKLNLENKNTYIGNIESALYEMLDLKHHLNFKFFSQKVIKIYGFLYLIQENNNQKYYLQMTKIDQVQINKIQISLNTVQKINFQKLQYQDYQLFTFDIYNNLQIYIKFVVRQTIIQYQEKKFQDSPFNMIEGVFFDKINKIFIKNQLFLPYKNQDENINFSRYLAQIFNQQLVIIGTMTFNQNIQARYRQLIDQKDQITSKDEEIFLQFILTMYDLRNILSPQKQIDLLYFILDQWNSDLLNLLQICINLKQNENHKLENGMQAGHYIILKQNSNFEYYISKQNIQNASKLYRAFISLKLLEVIILEQKQFGIIENNQNRVLIDQFQSISLSVSQQYSNQDLSKQKQQKYNVYLEIKSNLLNQICQQFKLFSVFDWISLIKCLLNRFDVYVFYQYLKIQFGVDLIIKLFIFVICSNIFQNQYIKKLHDVILKFKQQHEYNYLEFLLDLFRKNFNENIIAISQNIFELRLLILKIRQNKFSYIDYLIQEQQNKKHLNKLVYLAYFMFVNQQQYENLYYDIEEEKIYFQNKLNRIHINYHLFFDQGKLNKTLQYQFIISLLRNFQFQKNLDRENQLNYIINQYNFEFKLQSQGCEIISRLNYVISSRVYIIKYQQSEKQYLCSYHFGLEYLNYEDFKVIKNQISLDYHCQSITQLKGEIIRIKQLQKSNIQTVNSIINKMKNIAKILYYQGFEYEILEENLVIVMNLQEISVYPVVIKQAKNQLDEILNKINKFEQTIQPRFVKIND